MRWSWWKTPSTSSNGPLAIRRDRNGQKGLGRVCAESLRASGLCLSRFFFAASWRRGGFERAEKPGRYFGYFFYGSEKRCFVRLGWLIEAADLPYKLKRGGANLFGRYGRIKIEEH